MSDCKLFQLTNFLISHCSPKVGIFICWNIGKPSLRDDCGIVETAHVKCKLFLFIVTMNNARQLWARVSDTIWGEQYSYSTPYHDYTDNTLVIHAHGTGRALCIRHKYEHIYMHGKYKKAFMVKLYTCPQMWSGPCSDEHSRFCQSFHSSFPTVWLEVGSVRSS